MPKTYNHAFELCFEVSGSTTEDGSDVTEEQFRAAIQKRIDDLVKDNYLSGHLCPPFDTFEETK
jgi:hypothetical protein